MNHNEDVEKDLHGPEREFAITTWAVQNRTTVIVLTVLIFLMGIYSYQVMPKESFPEVVTPEIFVSTPYNSSSVVDIEKLITKPLEKEINTISGVDEIKSTTVPNFSAIDVKFNYNISPDQALRKVKDAVDKARGDKNFPTDLPSEPNVIELNFSELMPVMNINLSGDYPMEQLHSYAQHLKDRIESLPEINKVNIRGVPEREVRISLDLYKLEALQLNFNDIAQAIQMENLTMSGGELLTDGQRRAVRVIGEFTDMAQIRDIVVKNIDQKEVRLGDIATVDYAYKEPDSFAREYGKSVVMLDVIKRAGQNLLTASDGIQQILKEDRGRVLPTDLRISVTGDQSDNTRTSVDELMNHIILGVLLVIGTLMLFLGLRNAMFVGLAIPMSMFISFTLLNAFGVTLNIMVLFALILALGRLVDDGIVIVENIYRHMTNGEPAVAGHEISRGRGDHADHRRDHGHGDGVRAAALLARHDGLLHEVPAHHLHDRPRLLALRGLGGEPRAGLEVHEGGRGQHADEARVETGRHPCRRGHADPRSWPVLQKRHRLRHRTAHPLLWRDGHSQRQVVRARHGLVPEQLAAPLGGPL